MTEVLQIAILPNTAAKFPMRYAVIYKILRTFAIANPSLGERWGGVYAAGIDRLLTLIMLKVKKCIDNIEKIPGFCWLHNNCLIYKMFHGQAGLEELPFSEYGAEL